MTVFKGYLLGALRQKAVILLYLAIFLVLGMLMTRSMENGAGNAYETETVALTVVDRDGSMLSAALTGYLKRTQDVKELPDEQSRLQEELYYGNIQYVLVIPEGFEERLLEAAKNGADAGDVLEGTGRPGSGQSYYVRELAEGWLSSAALYLQAGFTAEEAAEHMEAVSGEETAVSLLSGNTKMSRVAGTFQYLPYILMALSCYVIGFVMLDYQRPEIRRRLQASAVSASRRLLEMLLAFAVIGAAFFCASFLMVWLMNPGGLPSEPHLGWYALNVASMVLVGLSVAFLVVHLAGSANGVNGLANVLALGMSFLGGVFIPVSLLSPGVRNVIRFLPVYWYEENNGILGTHSELAGALKQRLLEGCAWQLLFAAAVLALALLVRRVRKRA